MKDYLQVESQFVTGKEATYAYRQIGREGGRLLLLLPHLAATMDNWDARLMNALAKDYQLLVFDNQGVGVSSGKVQASIEGMAVGVLDFVTAMKLERFDLMGMSMGGFVAQEFLALAPEKVDKLILAGTGPRGGQGIEQIRKVTFSDMFRAGLERTDPKRFLFFNHDEKGKRFADNFLNSLNRRSKDNQDKAIKLSSFLKQLGAIKRWGQAPAADLSLIKQATLVINGDNDRMVPTRNSYDLAKGLSNSQLSIHPEAGHGIIFQYPETIATEIRHFLEN
ncbi:alpha/beta fold hydrolase [Streptococcus saliviloxodontae]|uniref:Pimeloyl-ACP methyl ester carboxylesterase n=1 Tax=Streptococcus saliviloxodontae TaxID=1349416 RepID=A0ABS2PML0_9STRE|nr:alpha/beta hydrolase [Streptococcus saliviloxodontae]MBM7636667.1 pimeloyl-ACP methyl ester carboxylesterase [Streptococcus saliviloxodontae]